MRWPIRRTADRAQGRTNTSVGRNSTANRLLPSSRLEAFSDGVFAIAITLLVLELHVPNGHGSLVSLVFIIEPLRRVRIRTRASSSADELAEPSAPPVGP